MSSKFCLTCTSILCILILSQYAVVVQCSCENIPPCHWNSWHEWSSCNATCGSGMQSRFRGPCCAPSTANSYMGCINYCNLTLSAGKDYQSCTACLTPPTSRTTTKTIQSTISTVLSTMLQLTKALETTTVRLVTTTTKPETTTATTTKTFVITTTHPQTKAYSKTTTSKPKSSTMMNFYSQSSTDEQTTRSITKRTTTPSGTTIKDTATPASVSPSATKAVLSGKNLKDVLHSISDLIAIMFKFIVILLLIYFSF